MAVRLYANMEVCVYGKDIRLARRKNRLSLQSVCDRMSNRGWPYYPSKLFRLENKRYFCLDGSEMQDLVKSLNETPTVHQTR